jgi:hypothetical protein
VDFVAASFSLAINQQHEHPAIGRELISCFSLAAVSYQVRAFDF